MFFNFYFQILNLNRPYLCFLGDNYSQNSIKISNSSFLKLNVLAMVNKRVKLYKHNTSNGNQTMYGTSKLNDQEHEILNTFGENQEKLHTQRLAENLGITRHTASKYLSILEAKGFLSHEEVGNAKVWYPLPRNVELELLEPEDIETILEIASSIKEASNSERDDGYLQNLEKELRKRINENQGLCIGAFAEDKLVGYIIGDEKSWEFGRGKKVGWIRVLGVVPEYQNRKIGKMLVQELLNRFKERGVEKAETIIDWTRSDLVPFFKTIGFKMSGSIVLDKKIG